MKILIGIDPGVMTGIAITIDGKIDQLKTVTFWEAIEIINDWQWKSSTRRSRLAVYIEDPTQNKPTFPRRLPGEDQPSFQKRMNKISQNVGMNKRDAQLLLDYCRRNKIPFVPVKPTAGPLTKMKKDYFNRITGWTGRSSQHSRDAYSMIMGR